MEDSIMNLIDILILNTSILDLICYPVLLVLVIAGFIKSSSINKKAIVHQQKIDKLIQLVNSFVRENSSDDILPLDESFLREMEKHGQVSTDPDIFEVPEGVLDELRSSQIVHSNIDLCDISDLSSNQKSEEQLVATTQGNITVEKEKIIRKKYTPDPETAFISDSDAKVYISQLIASAGDNPALNKLKNDFSNEWSFESLSKRKLTFLLSIIKHHADETAKQVTKKVYLLLNPETSKS